MYSVLSWKMRLDVIWIATWLSQYRRAGVEMVTPKSYSNCCIQTISLVVTAQARYFASNGIWWIVSSLSRIPKNLKEKSSKRWLVSLNQDKKPNQHLKMFWSEKMMRKRRTVLDQAWTWENEEDNEQLGDDTRGCERNWFSLWLAIVILGIGNVRYNMQLIRHLYWEASGSNSPS